MDRDTFNTSLIRYPQRQCLVTKPAIYSIYTNHYIIIIYHDNDYNYVYYVSARLQWEEEWELFCWLVIVTCSSQTCTSVPVTLNWNTEGNMNMDRDD